MHYTHLVVKLSSTSLDIPKTGDTAPTGERVINPYISGTDICGIDVVTNKYLGLYEADQNDRIVKFRILALNAQTIKE